MLNAVGGRATTYRPGDVRNNSSTDCRSLPQRRWRARQLTRFDPSPTAQTRPQRRSETGLDAAIAATHNSAERAYLSRKRGELV
jgi:hypothetical protein